MALMETYGHHHEHPSAARQPEVLSKLILAYDVSFGA